MRYMIDASSSIVRRLTWAMALAGIVAVHAFAEAAEFSCKAGDVRCLTDAILQANANGEANTIHLKAGRYTLTSPFIRTAGRFIGTGFPVITSTLTIQGASGTRTVVERDSTSVEQFRLFIVEGTGDLTLADLTLQGGGHAADGFGETGGGAVLNRGTLTIVDSVIKQNEMVGSKCGGIQSQGRLTVARSTITENSGRPEWPGGICVWGGTAMILESSIVANTGTNGAGIDVAGGFAFVQNSTIARNAGGAAGVGGVSVSGGSAIFINSTIAENIGGLTGGGGIAIFDTGQIVLSNTILARNRLNSGGGGFADCRTRPSSVAITSLGHNLIGDVTGCTITLVGGDLTGDPGLAPFRDNGNPGNGHFPLLPVSPANDAGLDAVCPRVDQLGHRRREECDIGAIRE